MTFDPNINISLHSLCYIRHFPVYKLIKANIKLIQNYEGGGGRKQSISVPVYPTKSLAHYLTDTHSACNQHPGTSMMSLLRMELKKKVIMIIVMVKKKEMHLFRFQIVMKCSRGFTFSKKLEPTLVHYSSLLDMAFCNILFCEVL